MKKLETFPGVKTHHKNLAFNALEKAIVERAVEEYSKKYIGVSQNSVWRRGMFLVARELNLKIPPKVFRK